MSQAEGEPNYYLNQTKLMCKISGEYLGFLKTKRTV